MGKDRFDVVVVGARCAGSPLATLLARRGLEVAVVEQATFPSDTLSTHVFEADGAAFLGRLGLADQLRGTGAPFVNRVDNRTGDLRIGVDWPRREGDIAGIMAVRRFVLDPILADAAQEAGAELRMGTKVTGLVDDGGRVSGVRVTSNGRDSELRASLVVGADGRNSTVARLAGARKYNVTHNDRAAYYAYFGGGDPGPDPAFVFHRWADRLILGCPCDGGVYVAVVMPDLAELPRFKADLEAAFMDHVRSCEPIAAAIAGGQREGKIRGIVKWEGFFRDASGPGWVLVGDAGHFKDIAAGRGISDAFCQVDTLAGAIVASHDGSGARIDDEMARWGRWRDRAFAEHYWWAVNIGAGGQVPLPLPYFVSSLYDKGEAGMFLDIQNHRLRPSRVLTPLRMLAATARMLVRHPEERRQGLAEVASFVTEDARRRWRNRHPAYASV